MSASARPDSAWLYLHFFDRELLTSYGVYDLIAPQRIHDDFVLCLLAVREPCYLSMSVLFESDYAFRSFQQAAHAYRRPDLLRLVAVCDNLPGFIDRKRDDYGWAEERYARYFSEDWRSVEEHAPSIVVKAEDTTAFLRHEVAESLTGLAEVKSLDDPVTRSVQSRLPALHVEEARPVTPALFQPAFDAARVATALRRQVNLQISRAYIRSSMRSCNGSIPTGLRCGLRVLEGLATSFPKHHLDLWRAVYTKLGIYPEVLELAGEDLVRLRDTQAHEDFVRAVRSWLVARPAEAMTSAAPDHQVLVVANRISQQIERCRSRRDAPLLARAEESMAAAARALARVEPRPNPRWSSRTSARARFRLDADGGTLQIGPATQVPIDPGSARVLAGLLHARRARVGFGPDGAITDTAVAQLFLGTRDRLPGAEASRVSYQFSRSLRRRLKRLGITERDMVIKRVRGSGVALGRGWAHNALVGGGSVRVVYGWNRTDALAAGGKSGLDPRRRDGAQGTPEK
jgi:hypothetical protein